MVNLANVDRLIKAGLGSVKKLAYYRIVLGDVKQGITSMVYRDYAIKSFTKLMDLCINDPILYNRLIGLLGDRQISEKAFDSLAQKSEKYSIPLEIIMEVWNRGYTDTGYSHLNNEEKAFNRVNSYIAGGAARELDKDLLGEMELNPNKREWGTTSLTNTYKNDTPGQSSKRLKTIKKVLKND